MLVTSASEVAVPGVSDLIFVLHDQLANPTQVAVAELVVPRELDLGLKPEFGFTIRRQDVDMHPGLLPGEEKEPVGPLSEDRRTHRAHSTRGAADFPSCRMPP